MNPSTYLVLGLIIAQVVIFRIFGLTKRPSVSLGRQYFKKYWTAMAIWGIFWLLTIPFIPFLTAGELNIGAVGVTVFLTLIMWLAWVFFVRDPHD
jgi:hypothetical protein